MRTILWRFLAVVALMFWQGGFLFYASVVVPVGQAVLGSHLDQGFITRRVTDYLNLSGGAALLVLAGEMATARDPSSFRYRTRWAVWAGMAVLLALLTWLHPKLDELIDPDLSLIRDEASFRGLHRLYLWVSTAQWGLGLVYAFLMLAGWRAEDRKAG